MFQSNEMALVEQQNLHQSGSVHGNKDGLGITNKQRVCREAADTCTKRTIPPPRIKKKKTKKIRNCIKYLSIIIKSQLLYIPRLIFLVPCYSKLYKNKSIIDYCQPNHASLNVSLFSSLLLLCTEREMAVRLQVFFGA